MSTKKQRKHTIFSNFLLVLGQAFTINKNPLPWMRAFCAGICSGLPVLIGYLLGHLEYGLIAGFGGFTYLYVFNIPYALRAKRLFFVATSLALAVWLGTILAPFPFVSAVVVALIGVVGTFIFGALQIKGPAAIFFILAFIMATGMPVNPDLAPIRAGLVLLGGAFSWLVGMVGWFANPHGPEKKAVKKVYGELACFMESIETEASHPSKEKLVAALKTTEDLLIAGYTSLRITGTYKRLVLLNQQANRIFLNIMESADQQRIKIPSEVVSAIQSISDSIGENKKVQLILPPNQEREKKTQLFSLVHEATAIQNDSSSNIGREINISKPSLSVIFGGAFDKNSIVFLTAVRFGFVLFVAAIIAHSFEFNRSFWVTLSCAAVLSGATIIATFHRAIQRSLGTLVGILLATAILYFQPEGSVIAIIIFLLTFMTELSIVLNYGLAALFITPNALLLAESSSHIHDISYFASARLIDVLIGCAIGLIGALLINRKSASSLLAHMMAKTIRSQQQFFLTLFSEYANTVSVESSHERSKMQTNLTNLKLVYATALGEIPRDKKRLELLWPALHSIEQLGYMLDSTSKYSNRPILSDEDLAKMLLVFETMAKSADQELALSKKTVPEILGFSKIHNEIKHLQNTLYINGITFGQRN